MAKVEKAQAVTGKTDPAIKAMIIAGAAILSVVVLTATFAGGFLAGRITKPLERQKIGQIGPQSNRQGMRGPDQQRQGQRSGQERGRFEEGTQLQEHMQEMGSIMVRGEVTEVDNDTITIKGDNGQEVIVTLASDAQILEGQKKSTTSEIKEGDHVMAMGDLEDGVVKANLIRIGNGRRGDLPGGKQGQGPRALGESFESICM